jgi:hypothetical protein
MRLVSLNCNQCGAPLEVPEKIRSKKKPNIDHMFHLVYEDHP